MRQVRIDEAVGAKLARGIYTADRLGRVVLPKPLLCSTDIRSHDRLRLSAEEGTIALRKHHERCVFCGTQEDRVAHRGRGVCGRYIRTLADHVRPG